MFTASNFEALFNDLYPKLYGYIRAQVNPRETAEDITATTFERAVKHRHTFNPQKGAIDSWLFKIARNLIIDHYSAHRRQPAQTQLEAAGPLAAEHLSPEQALLQQERRLQLLKSLEILPERDREIIHLRFFGKLTNRKIAEVMDLNEKTVSVIIYRTLKKLKSRLSEDLL